MRGHYLLAFAAVLNAGHAHAVACAVPDASFASFVVKFKNDARFRETRLILPLPSRYTDPDGTTQEVLSLRTIRSRKMQLIKGSAEARELALTEGKVCEGKPVVKGGHARFGQHSCGTDVYSHSYAFVRQNGCWMLESMESSGG